MRVSGLSLNEARSSSPRHMAIKERGSISRRGLSFNASCAIILWRDRDEGTQIPDARRKSGGGAPSSRSAGDRSRLPADPPRLLVVFFGWLFGPVHERGRLHRRLFEFADHRDEFFGLAAAFLFGQQAPVVLHVDLLALAPLARMEAGHVELAGFDAELGTEDEFFVRYLPVGLGLDPIVSAVISNVDDLLCEAEIAAQFPRAIKVLPKTGLDDNRPACQRPVNAPRGRALHYVQDEPDPRLSRSLPSSSVSNTASKAPDFDFHRGCPARCHESPESGRFSRLSTLSRHANFVLILPYTSKLGHEFGHSVLGVFPCLCL